MSYRRDTIVALATPPGTGGVAVIRVSGPDSLPIARRLFPAVDRGGIVSRRLIHGEIVDPLTRFVIDDGCLVFMMAPASYTGEDVVEFQTHGGQLIVRRVIESVLSLGARPAEPGEFTRRAFLNGRIDLLQAEGVIDLITARTDAALALARSQEGGELSRRLHSLAGTLGHLLALVEAYIDFPDEEPSRIHAAEIATLTDRFLDDSQTLLCDSRTALLLREGVTVALAGRPNVGKSSLLNHLLGSDRAIVTDLPGTTRDTIEETVLFGPLPVRLVDTAGIRESSDPVERLGVERSRRALSEADLVILLLDRSVPLTDDDLRLLETVSPAPHRIVLTKADLPPRISMELLPADPPPISLSVRTGEGIETLREAVETHFLGLDGSVRRSLAALSHLHQIDSLRRSREAVERFREGLSRSIPFDVAAVDLRDALSSLGEITGETTPDDLLDRIFSRFCIGK